MEFQKNKPKTGGRKKGTPNKKTSELRNNLLKIAGYCEETIVEDIKSLPASERLKFWSLLQQNLLPKYFPQEYEKQPDDEPKHVHITREVVYRALSESEIETGEWKND